MEIHMVENRQKGITKAYRNDKKDFDTSRGGTHKNVIFLNGPKICSE